MTSKSRLHSSEAGRGPARRKPYKGIAMEGVVARWYARIRNDEREFEAMARSVRERVPPGSRILEVAPGPGYLAILLSEGGEYDVTGLDISRTFVEIASARAREAAVRVAFDHGNASDMPYEDESFDFVACFAAFKNFTEPENALREMHRVLTPGGRALISDLRGDVSLKEIDTHIRNDLQLGRVNGFLTRQVFRHFLLRNAYSADDMAAMAARTPFRTCKVTSNGIAMEVILEK
jgi:ubiquinone/menaquinone biosynthesis C-methylase UbiE